MKKVFYPLTLIAFLSGCSMDKSVTPNTSGYPPDVSAIINTKCSTPGCHTASSKAAAGGLAMETWDLLFQGGTNNAVAIPYRPDQSWIIYFTNLDSTKGPILKPTMPYNSAPLSPTEWQTLYDWVTAGAPNSDGTVPFSGDPNRKKYYVSDQGCDLVSVFDAATKICMRIVDVGQNPGPGDVPHQIKVSPDGKYWYAILYAGTVVQKFGTADDSYIGDIPLGNSYPFVASGGWSTMSITPDGKYGFVISWADDETSGKIAVLNLDDMTFVTQYLGLAYSHGSWINSTGTTLYVTSQNGNFIYKVDVTNPLFPSIQKVVLVPGQQANNVAGSEDPHEVILSPDGTKYFVTCEASNKVRVMDVNTDTLITAITVSQFPLEMGISTQHNLLFVSCEYEPSDQPNTEGAISIIDLNTLQVIKTLQTGLYEPHGIGVMDDEGYVVISNRNLDINGPAPHHVSDCGGRDGFIQLIDLNTLDFIPNYKAEVSVDPYSVAVRH